MKYDAIESIAYEENMFRDTNTIRTNGFGNLKYSMGHFRDEIHGDYIRYTHNDCDIYVVMALWKVALHRISHRGFRDNE